LLLNCHDLSPTNWSSYHFVSKWLFPEDQKNSLTEYRYVYNILESWLLLNVLHMF
jgi:hypothetical protein